MTGATQDRRGLSALPTRWTGARWASLPADPIGGDRL
jgi:hypothetical protein